MIYCIINIILPFNLNGIMEQIQNYNCIVVLKVVPYTSGKM